MMRQQIKQVIEARMQQDGLSETGIPGVRLFRATQALPCAPAVYEPCVIAIVSGSKEAVLDGVRYVYDSSQYLCCPTSMPVHAGTPAASKDNPLFGVYISLQPRVMNELAMEIEPARTNGGPGSQTSAAQGIRLAQWDGTFTDALLRLLQLCESPADTNALGEARLREVFYAILKGDAGQFARHAFGPGQAIARSIAHLSTHLNAPISIDDLASQAGMSRAVFHRKFKAATSMSPIQFVKSMRLNHAAMKVAEGMPVTQAALDVGYVSSSQFSREFKRVFGHSPKQWGKEQARFQVTDR